jgi:hypothetical protein
MIAAEDNATGIHDAKGDSSIDAQDTTIDANIANNASAADGGQQGSSEQEQPPVPSHSHSPAQQPHVLPDIQKSRGTITFDQRLNFDPKSDAGPALSGAATAAKPRGLKGKSTHAGNASNSAHGRYSLKKNGNTRNNILERLASHDQASHGSAAASDSRPGFSIQNS